MLAFRRHDHAYFWDGSRVPSVTEVIRRGGSYGGLQFVNQAILDVTSDVGHLIHERIHDHHTDDSPLATGDSLLDGYLTAYETALAMLPMQVFHTEVPVGNGLVAGTLDLFCKYGGEWAVGDIKTTSRINVEAVELQTAAYAWLAEPFFGVRPTHRFVIQLRSDGTYEYKPLRDETALIRFIQLLEKQ